jgi:hypothetical protein
MFPLVRNNGQALDAEYVRKRARWEPVVEATQIKGDSESHPLLSPTDEFADYEVYDFALERIYDIAVSDGRRIGADGRCRTTVGNTVDLETGNYTNDIGDAQLAVAWTDPDFDPTQLSFLLRSCARNLHAALLIARRNRTRNRLGGHESPGHDPGASLQLSDLVHAVILRRVRGYNLAIKTHVRSEARLFLLGVFLSGK